MTDSSFCNADGDFLIVPQQGTSQSQAFIGTKQRRLQCERALSSIDAEVMALLGCRHAVPNLAAVPCSLTCRWFD